jgi:hypothetical protein
MAKKSSNSSQIGIAKFTRKIETWHNEDNDLR